MSWVSWCDGSVRARAAVWERCLGGCYEHASHHLMPGHSSNWLVSSGVMSGCGGSRVVWWSELVLRDGGVLKRIAAPTGDVSPRVAPPELPG